MNLRHVRAIQSQPRLSIVLGQVFTWQSRNHTCALHLRDRALLNALLESLESHEPIHVDENSEWSVS